MRPYHKRLIDGLHALGAKVRLHICGNTTCILPGIATLDCDMIDLDSPVSVAQARQVLGPGPVLAGNIDPVKTLCQGNVAEITAAITRCREEAGPCYIVAAGCEVPRQTPAANVFALASRAQSPGLTGN